MCPYRWIDRVDGMTSSDMLTIVTDRRCYASVISVMLISFQDTHISVSKVLIFVQYDL
jgi:hypothetical protein